MEVNNAATKKFLNKYQDVVPDALDGLCSINNTIRRIEGTQIITLRTPRKCVNIVCGGGSGHEPAHSGSAKKLLHYIGYVCDGILSAAVCGGVFSSPSYQDVLKAVVQVENENGVLLIVKNYTGDCINFELAADIARTKGISVMTLHVADDISFEEEQGVGRRGLAGTGLLYKALGFAANEKTLKDLHSFGSDILKNLFTIGASMSACSIPGYPPMYKLGDDEMEIGLGIHGEKGLKRVKVLSCEELVSEFMAKFGKYVHKGHEIVLMVNNLGACTDIEMMIMTKTLLARLWAEGINVKRVVEGRIMTSLEMHGLSATILVLDPKNQDYLLKCLDAPVDCKHWKITEPNKYIYVPLRHEIKSILSAQIPVGMSPQGECFKKMLKTIFASLAAKDAYYNQLDAEVGDGDLGIGVAKTSLLVLKNLDYFPFEEDIVASFEELGQLAVQGFGGTTGPLYAFFLLKGSQKLQRKMNANGRENWYQAFVEGFNAIQSIGKAELGDRTMLDAMHYAVKAFREELDKGNNSGEVAKLVAKAAEKGAEAASKLTAKRGRSSYLQGKEVGKKDPGCELVADWLKLIADNFTQV